MALATQADRERCVTFVFKVPLGPEKATEILLPQLYCIVVASLIKIIILHSFLERRFRKCKNTTNYITKRIHDNVSTPRRS